MLPRTIGNICSERTIIIFSADSNIQIENHIDFGLPNQKDSYE
jgi:hypothetical protein